MVKWLQLWLQSAKKHKKKRLTKTVNPLILLVPEVGIEPTRTQSSEDFESSASTNFTTPAHGTRFRVQGSELLFFQIEE